MEFLRRVRRWTSEVLRQLLVGVEPVLAPDDRIAVAWGELADALVQDLRGLGLAESLGGRSFARVRLDPRPAVGRVFQRCRATVVALLSGVVVDGVADLVAGDLDHPAQDAAMAPRFEVREPPMRDEQRFLHDVHRLEQAADLGPELEADDSAQPVLVAGEEGLERSAITGLGALDEVERGFQRRIG